MDKFEKQFEQIVGKLDIDDRPNAEHKRTLRQQMLTAHKESPSKKTAPRIQPVWSRIMKSNLTKSAAAIIIIAALTIIYQLTGSIDGASVAFAQMRKAFKTVPWIHVVTTGNHEDKNVEIEQWYGYKAKIFIMKEPDGKVRYSDYTKNKEYEYNPESNSIKIHYKNLGKFPEFPVGWEKWQETFDKFQPDAEISQNKKKIDGKDVNVYKISYVEKANHLELEIVVDISNDLPILGKFQALDSDGSLVSEGQMSFEYLEEGPATLYDVGVPASASAPSMEVEDAVDIYRAHREKSPSKYIAVVKEDDWKDVFNVDVIYKNGELERTERRSARTHNLQQKWSKVLSQSEIPFESLLALGLEGGKQWAFINLYDGQYSYGANKNNNDGWKVRDKSPTNNPHLQGTIADLGWPSLHLWSSDIVATNVIETDYSREHNLICVELLSEGSHDKNTGNIRLPLRELFYLNPERDYICQRHEYQREQNALWQKDRSWLDNIDPNDIPKDGVYLEEVKEFGQTETGQWYPKFIQKMAQSVVGSKTVYLETHSQFPEGIFDPENLPESDNSNE